MAAANASPPTSSTTTADSLKLAAVSPSEDDVEDPQNQRSHELSFSSLHRQSTQPACASLQPRAHLAEALFAPEDGSANGNGFSGGGGGGGSTSGSALSLPYDLSASSDGGGVLSSQSSPMFTGAAIPQQGPPSTASSATSSQWHGGYRPSSSQQQHIPRRPSPSTTSHHHLQQPQHHQHHHQPLFQGPPLPGAHGDRQSFTGPGAVWPSSVGGPQDTGGGRPMWERGSSAGGSSGSHPSSSSGGGTPSYGGRPPASPNGSAGGRFYGRPPPLSNRPNSQGGHAPLPRYNSSQGYQYRPPPHPPQPHYQQPPYHLQQHQQHQTQFLSPFGQQQQPGAVPPQMMIGTDGQTWVFFPVPSVDQGGGSSAGASNPTPASYGGTGPSEAGSVGTTGVVGSSPMVYRGGGSSESTVSSYGGFTSSLGPSPYGDSTASTTMGPGVGYSPSPYFFSPSLNNTASMAPSLDSAVSPYLQHQPLLPQQQQQQFPRPPIPFMSTSQVPQFPGQYPPQFPTLRPQTQNQPPLPRPVQQTFHHGPVGGAAGAGARAPSPKLVRKAWHPAPPAQRSEWVMWVGNVASDATHDELWAFFTSPIPPDIVDSSEKSQTTSPGSESGQGTANSSSMSGSDKPATTPPLTTTPPNNGVASIFLIARSNCAFVNLTSAEALARSIAYFNGRPLRPTTQESLGGAGGTRSARLVCRVRRKEDDLKSGVGGQRGRGVHTGWVKERKEMEQAARGDEGRESPQQEHFKGEDAQRFPPAAHGEGNAPGSMPISMPKHGDSNSSVKTTTSRGSADSGFLARHFPIRYFIMKSLTPVDLDTSVQQGLWATQTHNEPVLDQAYRTSKDVILIFGANKTGEFYGYARMASSIGKSERRISWASRNDSILSSSGTNRSLSMSSARGSVSPPISAGPLSGLGAPTAAPAAHHQRSAPERILEMPGENGSQEELDAAERERARTNPESRGKMVASATSDTEGLSAPQSNTFSFSDVQESPGEISPGQEGLGGVVSSGGNAPLLTSGSNSPYVSLGSRANLLWNRDGRAEPASAPAALESGPRNEANEGEDNEDDSKRKNEPRAFNEAEVKTVQSTPASPPSGTALRPLTEDECEAAIRAIAASSTTAGADHTPVPSPPSGPGMVDDDGVRRVDTIPSAPSGTSTQTTPTSPTTVSMSGSSAAFPLPNLHLPPSPPADRSPTGLPILGDKLKNNVAAGEGARPTGAGSTVAAGTSADGTEDTWGTPFKVEWVKTTRLPFHRVRHLRNSWNQDREIKVSRDGTEIEPEVGRLLLQAWEESSPPPNSYPVFLPHPPALPSSFRTSQPFVTAAQQQPPASQQ